jgi:hypothetical protein
MDHGSLKDWGSNMKPSVETSGIMFGFEVENTWVMKPVGK